MIAAFVFSLLLLILGLIDTPIIAAAAAVCLRSTEYGVSNGEEAEVPESDETMSPENSHKIVKQ